ncbi:hypothetical protein IQ250_16450 [Pseudanabaenaceae cyanobacterium LEGE 13415]|nr:hypothetical protein [Pseudanabaenaceae cyanobacterium LEGE 13415]
MVASRWNVLVEQTEDGKAIATILEFPALSAIAETRQAAINQVHKLLAAKLAQGEVVPIQLETTESKPKHPVLEMAGIFKDDPDFEAVQRHIQEYRDEIDALENEEPEPAIAKFAGIFKDDPDFAEIVKQMRAEREQPDEE